MGTRAQSPLKAVLSFLYRTFAEPFAKTRFGRSYPVKMIGYIVARLASKKVVNIHGHTLYLDPADSNRVSIRGEYEPFETALVEKLVHPGDVVVDLGANIGYYTLLFARLVGDEGRVFAFEPIPDNVALLEKNVRANGYRNVVLEPRAVSNQPGPVRLFKERFNDATASMFESDHCDCSIEVDAVRLDDYFEARPEDMSRITLIKMDVEGAEGLALEGMTRLLECNPNATILTEYLPNVLRRLGTEPERFLEILLGHGFKLYDINEEAQHIEPVDAPSFCAKYAMTWSNLLCARQLDEGVL